MNIRKRISRLGPGGFSVVETLMYLVLFSIVMMGLLTILRAETVIDARLQSLDSLHDIRQTSWKLSRWLTFGTRVLFPPMASDSATWHDKLMFTDQACQKRLVFLDSGRRLKMCSGNGALESLAENVVEFGVRRVDEMVVVFRVKVFEPKAKKTFVLSNTLQLQNDDLWAVCRKP